MGCRGRVLLVGRMLVLLPTSNTRTLHPIAPPFTTAATTTAQPWKGLVLDASAAESRWLLLLHLPRFDQLPIRSQSEPRMPRLLLVRDGLVEERVCHAHVLRVAGLCALLLRVSQAVVHQKLLEKHLRAVARV